jgi:hypothetical protein
MTSRELTEGIEDIIVHQCLEETQPSQIQIPGYADWNPWDSAAKTMFLNELEREAASIVWSIQTKGLRAAIELGRGRNDALR